MGLSSKQVCNDDDLSESLLDLPNYPSTTKEEVQQLLEGNVIDCPRCGSKNTKFCYYNNYNKSQPRHFCKGCKRHWTKGGTLRKVPVGGGRKNKRLKITPNSAKNAAASAAVTKASSTTNRNILMNDDRDCHEFHLGAHEGLKGMTDDEKNIPDILFETFIDNSYRDFSFSGGLESFRFDGNPSNTVVYPPWQSGGVAESMPDCWNLNDLDTLISADLNVPWPDDAEINIPRSSI